MTVVTRGARTGTVRGVKVLAWISFGLAAIGGSSLMSTTPGSAVAGLYRLLPQWLQTLGFVIGLGGMILDCWVDRTPNMLAVAMAILLPSVAIDIHGQLGATVRNIAASIAVASSARMGAWIGSVSALALAACSIGLALLVARRVVRKGGS